MVYVTWQDEEDNEVNIVSFDTFDEAKEFCKENGLNPDECCDEMFW